MSKAIKTVTQEPWGKVPIRDSKFDAHFTITNGDFDGAIPNEAFGCGLQNGIKRAPAPLRSLGRFLAAGVYKHSAKIFSIKGGKVKCTRFVLDAAAVRAVKEFDTEKQCKKHGPFDITLLAPRGDRVLGGDTRPRPPGVGGKSNRKSCDRQRRGLTYVDGPTSRKEIVRA